MLLKDKVCVITGCSRGIGKQTVKRFAEEGAIVYAIMRGGDDVDFDCKVPSHNGGGQI